MPDEQVSRLSAIGLYRSGITPPDQLRYVTVGRDDMQEDMRGKLRNSAGKASKQHSLFIGPRGVGKTHLLSLVAQDVHDDPKLAEQFIIVRFPEEALRLLSYVDFLLGTSEILQDALPADEAGSWRQIHEQLIEETDEDTIRDTLEDAIKRVGRDKRRTLLIMLENFGEVLTRQIKSKQDAAALRRFFMGDNGAMLVATAPLYFPGMSDVGQPFYGFFDVQVLGNLSAEETLESITKSLEWEKRQDLLDQFDALKPKILALHTMTGGNPRLIMMLYELIAHDSVLAVRDQFMRLLDRVTPFYQDRVKEIPPQERAVLETMAKMRNLVKTPAAIAVRMRMSQQHTSSLLQRLAKSHYLKSEPHPDDKRSRVYTIREGFFDLWLAMSLSRADRVRLPFLVDFFELWYRSLDEREEKRRSLRDLLKRSERSSDAKAREEAVIGLDHLSETGTAEEKAVAKVTLAQDLAGLGEADMAAGYIVELPRLGLDGLGGWIAGHALEWQQQAPDVYAELTAMIDCWQTQRSGDLEAFARALLKMGEDLSVKTYSEARVEFLTEALEHLPDPEQRVRLRLLLASILRELARWADAEAHLIAAKGDAEASKNKAYLAIVLYLLGSHYRYLARHGEAEPLLQRAIEITEKTYGEENEGTCTCLGQLALLLLETNRKGEAEPLYRRALDIAGNSLGEDHPHTVKVRKNLERLLSKRNG